MSDLKQQDIVNKKICKLADKDYETAKYWAETIAQDLVTNNLPKEARRSF